MTPEKLEALAADRAAVIQDAKKIDPNIKTEGCTCEQIKRDVISAKAGDALVVAVLGGTAIGDAKPELIDTAFRAILATPSKANPIDQMFPKQIGDSDPGQQQKPSSKADAWKQSI